MLGVMVRRGGAAGPAAELRRGDVVVDEEAAASDAGGKEAEGSGLQLLAPAGADDDGCGRPDASRTKGGGGTRRWCCSGSSLCSPEQGGGGIEGKLRGWFWLVGLDRGNEEIPRKKGRWVAAARE